MEGLLSRDGLYGFEYVEEDRRRSANRQTPEIKQLWQRSHEIINLAARGFKHVEIAEILNITPSTVSNTLNSELGMRKLSEIRGERDEDTKKTVEKIRVLTDKALNVYHEVFDDESGELGLKDKVSAAKDFLSDMSGLKAPTRIQTQSVSTVLTKEELDELKSRGAEAARQSGLIIDDIEETV